MKTKIAYTTLLFLLLTVTSCKKFLAIDPKFKFPDTKALSSLNGLALTTTGAFHQLQSGNLYGGGMVANSELLADFVNTDAISDFDLNQLKTHQISPVNGICTGMWADAYRAIYIANVVLETLPKFKGENPALEANIAAECYFIRGIMYYELVRRYAQPSGYTLGDSHLGVPLVLKPGNISEEQSTPRATVAEVYAQIISDLKQAELALPTSPKARASVYAAQAFLTKAYFSQNKFEEAKAYADKVIAGGFTLNTTPDELFKNSSLDKPESQTAESIFEMKAVTTDNFPFTLQGRFRAIPFAPAQNRISELYRPYITDDSLNGGTRAALLHKRQRVGTVFYYYTRKYDVTTNLPVVIRLSEILLDRAECNAQLGADDATVRADYNLIRKRGGLIEDNTTSGKAALLSAIRSQRDYELSFEGDRFHEIKRRKGTFNYPDGSVFQWNDDKMIYPIPQQEVELNKNMTQNPGY